MTRDITRNYTGEHPCGKSFLIYRNASEPWDYHCPQCFEAITRQQTTENENVIPPKFTGRLN